MQNIGNSKIILIYIYFYYYYFKNNNLLINEKSYYNVINKYKILFLKYYYVFIKLYFSIFKLYFSKLNKENKYFKKYNLNILDKIFLKYKDNRLLIFLESYNNGLIIHNYKNNYFYNLKNINVFLYKNFVFKIEIIIFLIFRDYIEFIRRYKYNEYLDENPKVNKYPILKVLLRNVDQVLLKMIKKKENNFIRREEINKNYNFYYIEIEKKKKYLMYLINRKYLNVFFRNEEFLKTILLLFKVNILRKFININLIKNIFLFIFWYRKIKHYEITKIYSYDLEGYDWTRSNKLKSENVIDFFLQMQRYGFMMYYYYPLTLNLEFYNFNKNKIMKLYNIYNILLFFKNISINKNIINIFWYEIIKIISSDYLKRYLFIFIFINNFEILYKHYRHNKRRIIEKFNLLYTQKSLNFKYIYLKFKDLINIMNFKIYPINHQIYLNKKNLLEFFKINKKNFNFFYWQVFFLKNNDYYNNYCLDFNLIFKKIFMDLYIKNIYINIFNVFFKSLWKNNIENIYINIFHYIKFIRDLINKLNITKSISIINYNKLINKEKIKFLCFFKTYTGIDLWNRHFYIYKNEWKWMYEVWLIFYVFRLYILDFYYYIYILWINYKR